MTKHFLVLGPVLVVGWALPLSKNVPDSDSLSSILNPSELIVISMWLFKLSKLGICRVTFCNSSLSLGISSLVSVKFSPEPDWSVPTIFDFPVGSLKYPPTAS